MLHAVASVLRRGGTLHQALAEVALDPDLAGSGLQVAAGRVDRGDNASDAIDAWASTLEHPDADMVRAVLRVGLSSGSALAVSLDRAAGSLQDRAELQREVRALSAQARASVMVLTVAPLLFLALMSFADPRIVSTAVGTSSGRVALMAGLVLDAGGWVWMRRLVDGVDQ